jgi:hypothetical protein
MSSYDDYLEERIQRMIKITRERGSMFGFIYWQYPRIYFFFIEDIKRYLRKKIKA